MTDTTSKLQETLEADFPLLDTSLLAALILDLPSHTAPCDESFQDLREMLSQLSIDAEVQQQQAESLDASSTYHPENVTNELDTSVSSVRLDSDDLLGSVSSPDDLSLSTSGLSSASTSATSTTPSASALEFLRIPFPHLSVAKIKQTLREYNLLDDDLLQLDDVPEEVDMCAVVDHLLTLEYIQDLTERGLDATSDVESDLGLCHPVSAKGKHVAGRSKAKLRPHKRAVPFVDIRQRQHVLREPPTKDATLSSSSSYSDPWTRLASLATRLSDLLQPTPAGFFMSYFHAPPTIQAPNTKAGWKGEGAALRGALSDLIARAATPVDDTELWTAVEVIRDIVLTRDAGDSLILDAEQQAVLTSDAHLCVLVAKGNSATALDLVWLLRELDDAFDQGNGVAHSLLGPVVFENDTPSGPGSSSRPLTTPPSGAKPPTLILPTQPPPIPPPPLSQKHPSPALSSKKDRGWTVVQPRRPAIDKYQHPHAEFIPAYSNHVGKARGSIKGPGNRFGKGGKGDVGELSPRAHSAEWYKARAGELQTQRNEALREATRHWQRGNAKTHGGEVALYYAEKARELQEQQKTWALGAARVMVAEKRSTSTEPDTLDLHGLTVTEACVIVKEAISTSCPSSFKPLKVITGRGRHSVGHVGVLGPAVRDMLRSEGWHVGKWDGGLIVRGKS